MNFKNQTILITGGAQGIGFALSKKFSTMGANVVIADKQKDTPNIAENFGGFGYVCDVTKEEELNSFITFAEDKLGGVNCFISNAGTIFVDPDHVASAPKGLLIAVLHDRKDGFHHCYRTLRCEWIRCVVLL